MIDKKEIKKIERDLQKKYKIAEEWLLFYEAREAQYDKDLSYIRGMIPTSLDARERGTGIQNWTEFKIVKEADLDDWQKWIAVIGLVESGAKEETLIFINIRRNAAKKNVKNWSNYVHCKYTERISEKQNKEFNISERTIIRWWVNIVKTTRLIAMLRGCKF